MLFFSIKINSSNENKFHKQNMILLRVFAKNKSWIIENFKSRQHGSYEPSFQGIFHKKVALKRQTVKLILSIKYSNIYLYIYKTYSLSLKICVKFSSSSLFVENLRMSLLGEKFDFLKIIPRSLTTAELAAEIMKKWRSDVFVITYIFSFQRKNWKWVNSAILQQR